MAHKIKLGGRPKSFARTVTFPMLTGEDGCMEVTYKFRTRKELASLIDEITATAEARRDSEIEAIKAKAEKGEEIDAVKQVDILDRDISLKVDYIMQALDGWNLDEKLTRSAVEQLADEVPAAITAIIDTYRKAINEGRLGN